VDVEDSADSGHHLDRAHAVFPLLENPRRQTGGVGERPSGDAVFDADVVAVGHRAHSRRGGPLKEIGRIPWPPASSSVVATHAFRVGNAS
jgi:hypothetical protein